MKNIELRLGNLIQTTYEGVLIVQGIAPDHILACKKIGLPTGYYPIGSFDFVPLTDRIIQKVGFTKFGKYTTYNLSIDKWNFQIEKHPAYKTGYIFFIDIDDVAAPPSVHIESLHHLQNLIFDFTGQELTIKL